VLGPVEVHGHSEMSPCWRPLLAALSDIVPVMAGSRHVPDWIRQTRAMAADQLADFLADLEASGRPSP
jgi:hypothetical protein